MSKPVEFAARTILLKSLGVCLLIATMFSASCRFASTDEATDSLLTSVPGDPKDANIIRKYYPDGKIHKEIVTNNGTKTGLAREYYQNGKVFQEVNYQSNIREGIAKRYYETGKLSQETPYRNDRMHGIQKKYRRSGNLAAEITYYEGHLCTGLKEYTIDGILKKRYPEIEITPINNIFRSREYILEVKMSDDSKGVQYYTGELVNGKYIREEMNTIWDTKDGIARIHFTVAPGDIRMEEVNIIAKVKTAQSNYYITQKKFRLSVENSF
jgi:hypothetical protein